MGASIQSAGTLAERVSQVRARMEAAALGAGRQPEQVTLMAVSKTHPPDLVRAAMAAGVIDFGENKVQEAEEKIPQVGRDSMRWHLIGHLQSNKARKAVELFDVIHSLDSVALARKLERTCEKEGRAQLPVLMQIDLGGEATKSGVTEDELPQLIETIAQSRRLRLQGLMTLPPFYDNPEEVRPFFRRLRDLRDELRKLGAFGDGPGELSMGMTHDFEIAIEEGATIVRVGTAIFGERGR
jgi:pyridoxal phosphate enzyme (YggS family)